MIIALRRWIHDRGPISLLHKYPDDPAPWSNLHDIASQASGPPVIVIIEECKRVDRLFFVA
jgi:hypothetical protein